MPELSSDTVKGQTFGPGEVVNICDGRAYVDCTFDGATLEYDGIRAAALVNSTIRNVKWHFLGPAGNTAVFISEASKADPRVLADWLESVCEDRNRAEQLAWQVALPTKTIRGQVFKDVAVRLDHVTFEDCTFDGALLLCAGNTFNLDARRNKLTRYTMVCDGPLGDALIAFRRFAHSGGPGLVNHLADFFNEAIRQRPDIAEAHVL